MSAPVGVLNENNPREPLLHPIPHPPAQPPRSGNKYHGPDRGELAVGVLVILASVVLTILNIWYLETSISPEMQMLGFTMQQRSEQVNQMPKDDAQVAHVKDIWQHAVTTFISPASEYGKVHIAAIDNPNKDTASRDIFMRKTVFGFAGDYALISKDIYKFQKRPSHVIPCTFENHQYGWRSKGACAFYPTRDVNGELEELLQVVALKHGKPAFLKWWPHTWGGDDSKHTTMVQTVLPSLPSLHPIRNDMPVYLLG
mmetsp:Transcript_3046/g.4356  ORF Transcript_3046/g.4356 Transcript_3046/m.4356 type:complete len:256 (-) Transcript_3046:15-782(-)